MKTIDSSLLVIKNRAIALMLQLLERLGYPVSLRDLIISMPAFRTSELPSYKSIAVGDITNWSDWGGYPLTDKITNRSLNPHAEILGRAMHSGHYKCSIRTVPAMQKLTLINEIPSWECEIQEVEGISNSKSDIYSFETLDQMVATNSKKMITPVSDEKLRENLEWQEIRIIHAKYAGDHFEKFSWDDRVFLINSGGSHHFAAARYIASRIKENIQLEGRLVTHTLNADAVQELRAEFEIFLISKSCAVQACEFQRYFLMNKQFSPFLQRYFLIITEVICNQIKKYRGIFKSNRKSTHQTLVKQRALLPLLAKHIPVKLFGLNIPFESKSGVSNLNTYLRIQQRLYFDSIFNWAAIACRVLGRYVSNQAVINGYIFYKKVLGNCGAFQNAIQSNIVHREPFTGVSQ